MMNNMIYDKIYADDAESKFEAESVGLGWVLYKEHVNKARTISSGK